MSQVWKLKEIKRRFKLNIERKEPGRDHHKDHIAFNIIQSAFLKP